MLDLDVDAARQTHLKVKDKYPIAITRVSLLQLKSLHKLSKLVMREQEQQPVQLTGSRQQ